MTELRQAWIELLARRRSLAASLAPYGEMLERWAAWTPPRRSLSWSAQRCRESWTRAVPLAAEAPPPLDAGDVEDLLGGAMEEVAAVDPARAPALQRLAGAWDAGAIRSEEHTSELQSRLHLVCRLLLEKKKKDDQR